MKILTLAILLLAFCSIAFADDIEIPFSCYPKYVKECFAKAGKQLDLSGNDRTANSWGFIENKGTLFILHTYQPTNIEELQQIQSIIMESMKHAKK